MGKEQVKKESWIIYCEQQEIQNIFWLYLIDL